MTTAATLTRGTAADSFVVLNGLLSLATDNSYEAANDFYQYKWEIISLKNNMLTFSVYVAGSEPNAEPVPYQWWQIYNSSHAFTAPEAPPLVGLSLPDAATRRPGYVRAEWQAVEHSLESFRALRDGWNGEGAKAPSSKMLDHARDVVRMLNYSGVTISPKAFVVNDGEVCLRWNVGDKFCSISFYPDGHIVGYAIGPNWTPLEIDEPFTPDFNLDDLIKYLTAI